MTLLVALLASVGAASEEPVSFRAEGLVLSGAPVADPSIQLRSGPTGLLLVSRTVVEPLEASVAVAIGAGLTIVVEPGVRLARVGAGFELSAPLKKKVRIAAGPEAFIVLSPASVGTGPDGWLLGVGRPVEAPSITVSQAAQDDADKNLKELEKAAKAIEKSAAQPQGGGGGFPWPYLNQWPPGAPLPPWFPARPASMDPSKAQGNFFLFRYFDPFTASLASDPQTIQTLDEISPLGF